MFVRKQREDTLTQNGRCWEWARGKERIQYLKTDHENGVPVIYYVDTKYPQFIIAVVYDGTTESGHALGTPLSTYTTCHPE